MLLLCHEQFYFFNHNTHGNVIRQTTNIIPTTVRPCLLVNWPAQDVDTLCVVLERSELRSENLQGIQDLPILQILQIFLLQQQKLHSLNTKNRRGRVKKTNKEYESLRCLWAACPATFTLVLEMAGSCHCYCLLLLWIEQAVDHMATGSVCLYWLGHENLFK